MFNGSVSQPRRREGKRNLKTGIMTTDELKALNAELLAALKELHGVVNGNNRPPKYAEPALKKARTVITKAQGFTF